MSLASHVAMFPGNSDWPKGTPDPAEPIRIVPRIALFILRSLSWESECGLTTAIFPAICVLSAEAVKHNRQRGEKERAKEVWFLKLLLQFYGVILTACLSPWALKLLFCLSHPRFSSVACNQNPAMQWELVFTKDNCLELGENEIDSGWYKVWSCRSEVPTTVAPQGWSTKTWATWRESFASFPASRKTPGT